MKTERINLSLILAWLAVLVFPLHMPAQGLHMEKGSVRYYSGKDIRKVKIDNDYGHIRLEPDDRRSVLVVFIIHVEADNGYAAEQAVKIIRPRFRLRGDSLLEIETRIADKDSWKRIKSHIQNYYVDYTLKLPRQAAAEVNADYGTLHITDMDAPLTARMDYGKLYAGELRSHNNILYGDYMDTLSVDFMRGGKIYSDYSSIRIGLVFRLHIQGDYNKIRVDHAKNFVLFGDHNRLRIGRVKNLQIQGDYQRIRIHQLYNGKITGDYNEVVIQRLANGPYRLHLDGNYGKFRILNTTRTPFRFDLKGDFNLSFAKEIRFMRNAGHLERHSTGYYGNPDAPYLIHGYLEHSRVYLMYPYD